MPNYDAWPTFQDIEVLLKSAAFWPEGTPDTAKVLYAQEQARIGVAAAGQEFEHRTGWTPFLSSGVAPQTRVLRMEARRFSASGFVPLRAGLLQLNSVTVNGVAASPNAFYLTPSDAPEREKPYTAIQFVPYFLARYAWAWRPIEIAVTGRWGYCDMVPADVWAEVLQYGAVKALSQVENRQSIASISQDGFSKSWDIVGVITQKDLLNEWGKRFDRACEHYRRMTL